MKINEVQKERIEKLFQQLNPPQKEAVSAVNGPVLVVAGAGSGKTRVITYRIPFLLLSGTAASENILALTFTNKAANEMKVRTQILAGSDFRPPLISTFHSFGALLLRKHIHILGHSRNFMVFDEDDQLSIVKEACKRLNLNEQRYDPREIQYFIKWHKTRIEPPPIHDMNMQRIIEMYERNLREANCVDFDDLLLIPLVILRDFPEIRGSYLNSYTHVMVDEYQDTNEIQYEYLNYFPGKTQTFLLLVMRINRFTAFAGRVLKISSILLGTFHSHKS